MSVFSAADSMMTIATTEAMAAGLILPPAMWVNFEFKASTGKPDELNKAGEAWREAGAQLQQTANDLLKAAAAIPSEAWTADARGAYEQKVRELAAQFGIMDGYCQAAGITLTTLAYALLAYAGFAYAIGTILAAITPLAAMALAGGPTALSYPGFLATAGSCLTATHVATGILGTMGQIGAAVLAGGTALSAYKQAGEGNTKAFEDLMQAQATGSAGALANLTQNAANAGLNYLNRTDRIKVDHGHAGVPVGAIDLDADRDKDRTWSAGGGASFKTGPFGAYEHEAGAHAKYGDRGLQGLEAEGKSTFPNEGSVGGKAGWEESGDGKNSFHGGVNGGYGSGSWGASGGAEGKYTTDGSWSAKGEGGAQYQGGDAYKESHEAEHKDGKTTYKDETSTVFGDQKYDGDVAPWNR
jgi:hypothetical protein